MARISKIFKVCKSSRIESPVVVSKILIFLAIYTQAVSSVPLEERNLHLSALGRISSLGCVYDARTNSFSDTSIFQSNLPSHLITTTNTPRTTKKSQIIKTESDKFKIFGVDLDTAASIQMQIVQPEGAAGLLSEDITNSADVTGVFLHTFQTAKQTFSILQGELKNYYHTDFQLFKDATHIVTGIHWGGSNAVTFTDTRLRDQSRAQRVTLMGKEMAKLKRSSINISNKTVSFEMHLTSDGSPQIAFPAPTSLSEIQNQINQVQESVMLTNSGLGVPLKFTLTPISVLSTYLNVTTTLVPKAHGIDEKTLREYLNVIDDIRSTSKAVNKLEENAHCVPKEVNRELEKLQANFQAAEQDFEIMFKKVFLDVKSGDSNNSALAQVLRNYENQVPNPKTVRAFLDLHEQALIKVDFCIQLNEEYPEIQYFGSGSNLVSTIYQNLNKPTYVLLTKSEFEKNDHVFYEDNLNVFFNLLYKPSNALFIVDCDFSYLQCQSINRTVIKQIRQGKYTFDDVRLEIKILEMEKKNEIVECNSEPGITGALCVSTVGITSAKSKTKPLNKIEKKPEESRRSNKVVGGNIANPNEFPFQVLFLKNETRVHCGGTILNENSILTAAHCLHDDDYIIYDAEEYESWTIVAGDHNWQQDEGTEQRRKIRELHVHRKYIPISEVNDIAIVQLDRPLQLSAAVQPILLPDADYEASGNAIVTGWGRLQSGGANPLVLQKVTVPIVDRADCVEAYEEDQVFVSVKMLCAGHLGVGGVDACQGDSGGPLSVQLSNGSSMLVGVVSGGIGCARPEYPGIYMQVSKYVDWIKGKMEEVASTTAGLVDCDFPNHICNTINETSLFIYENRSISAFQINSLDSAVSVSTCSKESCLNGGTCIKKGEEISCECTAGFIGERCEDIECVLPGTCSSAVTKPSSCECRPGYVKDARDSAKCKSSNSDNATLLFGDNDGFQQISISQRNTTRILSDASVRDALDFHYPTETMFWSGPLDTINSAPISAGASKTLVFTDTGAGIVSIAIDWVHHNLYYADIYKGRISVANLDGSMKKVLVNDGLYRPSSIVVNPSNGWMYWVDASSKKVERAGMDGSQRQTIATSTDSLWGLAIDYTENRLYWTKYGDHPCSIHSMNTDGSDQKLVLRAALLTFSSSHFTSIAIFEDFMYWRDESTNKMYRANKCDGAELTELITIYGSGREVKVYHVSKQPAVANACARRTEQCSHLCLPTPRIRNATLSSICACPDGRTLSSNGHNCS